MRSRPEGRLASTASRAGAALSLTCLYGASGLWRSPSVPGARAERTSGHVAVADPQSGQALLLLMLDHPLGSGMDVWGDRVPDDRPLRIRVDRKSRPMSVFRGRCEIGAAVTLYGSPDTPTPGGTFFVREKLKDHRSSLYDADMPLTLRPTDDGISIPGLAVRPPAGTHGGIGLPLTFSRLLFEYRRRGDRVLIL